VKRLRAPGEHGVLMTDFAGIIHATPAADPKAPVMVPGEIELEKFHRQRAAGIAIDARLRRELESLAARGAS
jgi:ureidoglycolate dehydrogenase (NAD+)